MRFNTSILVVAIVAAISSVSVCALSQESWTPPKQPDYDLKTNGNLTTPPGGTFPTVSADMPINVEGMLPSASTFVNQQWFDMFSWKVFIALNWPAYDSQSQLANYGQPIPIGNKTVGQFLSETNARPRVWETFMPPELIFKSGGAKPDLYNPWEGGQARNKSLASTTKRTHLLNEVDEAFFNLEKPLPPILDVNQEYARYEVALNKIEYEFILNNQLFSKAGQATFLKNQNGNPLLFPPGSMEIKAAWKKLTLEEIASNRFYMQKVDVYEPFAPGKPTETDQTYGLVGFHIMYIADGKVNGPNKPDAPIHEGVWPTFEHVDNAPMSDLRQKPLGVAEWGWEGDSWVRKQLKPTYSFFNPNGATSSLNTSIGGFSPASRAAMEKTNAIYNSGSGNYFQPKEGEPQLTVPERLPSQIAKVITDNNAIVASQWTYELNARMQEQLPAPWKYYRLVTTQRPTQPGLIEKWNETQPSTAVAPMIVKAGNPAPVSLGNAVAETYMQINGSCMSCHAGATFGGTDNKQADANFSFMLQRAK